MTATKKTLSAAAVATALVLTACISDAQAQFGPMGMGMMRGPMGMGMRGPMGMSPGMGSARTIVMGEPRRGSRHWGNYRSRDRYEEPPRKEHARVAKPKATFAAPVQLTRATVAWAPQQASVATPVGAVQPKQYIQPAQNTPPAQNTQPAQSLRTAIQAPVIRTLPEAAQPAPLAQPEADIALPVRITPQTRPLNCMAKLHLKDGTVILQDFCTLEQAVIKQGETSQVAQPQAIQPAAQQAQPQPQQIEPRQAPALLARNR